MSVIHREKAKRATQLTKISMPNASLNEFMRTNGVLPIRPTTPWTTSSDRNCIGLGTVLATAFLRLRCCQYKASEADDKLKVKPKKRPSTKSRVNLTFGRFHSLNQFRNPFQGREDMACYR